MSSPGSPSSVPGSPTKAASMAVDKDIATPRSPLRDASVNSTRSWPADTDTPKNPGEVVQVPSTAPPTAASVHKPEEAQNDDQVVVQHVNDAEEAPSESETVVSEGAATDLPTFDWEDLQIRYTKAIQKVNHEEEVILEEFYKYSDVGVSNYMLEMC